MFIFEEEMHKIPQFQSIYHFKFIAFTMQLYCVSERIFINTFVFAAGLRLKYLDIANIHVTLSKVHDIFE